MEVRRKKKKERSLSPSHTSLMLACQQENDTDVQLLLERQPGLVHQRDRTGKNALHYCAENSNLQCVSQLLTAAPALLNSADDEGYTPLHLAVISSNKPVVKYLLSKGADARAVDSEKHTCVHWATVSGDWECIDLLIDAGANPSTPDIHGAYPVHYAAQMCGPNSEMGNDVRKGLAVLTKLLSRGVDVSCTDRDGRSPLLWAASGGSSDAILAIVKAGADINAADHDGLTALHCAASRGHVDCLETLITLCASDVDRMDDNGCSALFYAVTLGHADCTNLLLTFGSQPNKQDNKGRSPAHCGAAKGQMETLKILLQNKANLWLRNAKGDMPIHEAVQSARKDLVEWFLQQHQGSVNVSNANGRTPLHIAAITNNVDMCKVLMDYGAFINPIMRNSKGQQMTPLDAALHRGNRGCAKYLNLHGALPASKLLEKQDYKRFDETQLPETLDPCLSPKQRSLRDSSAQTESVFRDAQAKRHAEAKATTAAKAEIQTRVAAGERRPDCSTVPCPGRDTEGKPIIAKVYVHTKRTRGKKFIRRPTAYRRDAQGQKAYAARRLEANSNLQRRGIVGSDDRLEVKEVPISEEMTPDNSQMMFIEEVEPRIPEEAESDLTQASKPDEEEEEEEEEEDEEEANRPCPCLDGHEEEASCDCECHVSEPPPLLTTRTDKTKESDVENQSPLSSIRSLESTVKDSGFSDDVERMHHGGYSSEDEAEGESGKRRHIARYVVSSGAAETFRLDEEDEEEEYTIGSITPRSSSMPLLFRKKEEPSPRLLNRPTMTKDVQRSLKKYQMERRLFYELQQLKRKQIVGAMDDEKEIVQKIVERFRQHVQSPPMSDFQGPFTFRTFEKYLYEQLRKLSMGGKIPKPKVEIIALPARTYTTSLVSKRDSDLHAVCVCETHNCRHRAQHGLDMTTAKEDNEHVSLLPEIVRRSPGSKRPQSRIPVNRSKSWDRLEANGGKSGSPFGAAKLGNSQTSSSLPALSNPFPRRVPASLLAAISQRLGNDVHPDDTVVVEMTAENIASKMMHAFTVRELREVVARYEAQAGHKVKPIPLESVLDPRDDGPITFEIRHGKERNVFKLPADKLKDNKKWFLHYCLWPVGRYILPIEDGDPVSAEDIHWREIQLNPKAILLLPPNFWT